MTPNIAIVQVETPHWHGPRLWIPLFLLWIPAILLSPLILLVLLAMCIAGKVSPWYAVSVVWGILSSLSGTHVRVSTQGTNVLVQIL